MKHVVIISGSRRKGNTLAISKLYKEEFGRHGLDVFVIDLSDIEINMCDGCLECDESHRCKFEDGTDRYIELIRNADLVMFGSPARWRLMSGEMKSFIDRLNPYACVEGYSGINAFVFSVGQSAEEDGESVLDAIESICLFVNDAGMNLVGKQAFYGMYGATDYMLNDINNRRTCQKNVDDVLSLLD